MITLGLGLGATAKTKFVKDTSMALAILAIAIFVSVFYWDVAFAFVYRGFWALTVLLCFVDCVFFLGCMIVCNQDVEFENGGVTIRKGGLLYRMIFAKPMGMEKRRQDLTLCSISWLGMFVIIFYPLIYILGHIVTFLVAIGTFIVAAQNPFLQNRWWHEAFAEDYGYNKAWETLYIGSFPLSPLLIALIASLFGAGIWILVHIPWMGWWLVLQLSVALLIFWAILTPLAYLAALLIDRAEAKSLGYALPEGVRRTDMVLCAPRVAGELAITPIVWVAIGIKTVFEPFVTMLRTFKKVACPKINIK